MKQSSRLPASQFLRPVSYIPIAKLAAHRLILCLMALIFKQTTTF